MCLGNRNNVALNDMTQYTKTINQSDNIFYIDEEHMPVGWWNILEMIHKLSCQKEMQQSPYKDSSSSPTDQTNRCAQTLKYMETFWFQW